MVPAFSNFKQHVALWIFLCCVKEFKNCYYIKQIPRYFCFRMTHAKFCILIAVLFVCSVSARLAGECAALCNDLRFEVLTMEMCR
jgi:hypothetical protein